MYDIAIVGGGIIGVSLAYRLSENSKYKICLLEKESDTGLHQSSHNSGVVHSGIYYKPGSLKSKFCRHGQERVYRFCNENNIKFKKTGKLIVSTSDEENSRIEILYKNAIENKSKVKLICENELKEMEPNITGKKAILSNETGIVDFHEIAKKMTSICKSRGVNFYLNFEVHKITENRNLVEISSKMKMFSIQARKVVFCAGINSEEMLKISGLNSNCKMLPFRGEYYFLSSFKEKIVSRLIYPVPDPNLPFLGTHITPLISGRTIIGPNAVISLSKDEYSKYALNLKNVTDIIKSPEFWKLIWKYRSSAINEALTFANKRYYLRNCQRYCPSLEVDDLESYFAGIRAQVVSGNGELVHDFKFASTKRMVHVINAPSPAATSCFMIADYVIKKYLKDV